MNKDQIHAEYLRAVKDGYGSFKTGDTESRSALVVGSNGRDNIGAAIANKLEREFFVQEVDASDNFDIRRWKDCRAVLADYKFDTLVLSHGVTRMDWIENQSPESMEEIVSTNLTGTAIMIGEFVKAAKDLRMRKKIVIIGSMASTAVLNASAVYCASKAGVAHLVRCLGWELTPKGFDVFGVHPSNTEGTPMTAQTIKEIKRYRFLSQREAEEYWGSINLKDRWLQPEDIASIVWELVTQSSFEWMSGQNLGLPGGQR